MRDIVSFRSSSWTPGEKRKNPEGPGAPSKNRKVPSRVEPYLIFLSRYINLLKDNDIEYIIDGSNHIGFFEGMFDNIREKARTDDLKKERLRISDIPEKNFNGKVLFVAKVDNMKDESLLDNYFYHLLRDNPSVNDVWTLTIVLPKVTEPHHDIEYWTQSRDDHSWTALNAKFLAPNMPRVLQMETVTRRTRSGKVNKSMAVLIEKEFLEELNEEQMFTDEINEMFNRANRPTVTKLHPKTEAIPRLHDLMSFDDFFMAEIRKQGGKTPLGLKWKKVRSNASGSDVVHASRKPPPELKEVTLDQVIKLTEPWTPRGLTSFDQYVEVGGELLQPVEGDFFTIITKDKELREGTSQFHRNDDMGHFLSRLLTELLSTSTISMDHRIRRTDHSDSSENPKYHTMWVKDDFFPYTILSTKPDLLEKYRKKLFPDATDVSSPRGWFPRIAAALASLHPSRR